MRKLFIAVLLLIVLYLLFRNAEPYKAFIEGSTSFFNKTWSSFTGG